MQTFSLLILSSVTLAASWQSSASKSSTCILGGDACPTGSSCTPTQTCGGLCFTPTPLPPAIPCTVGNDGPCPTNSICTPTMICPTATPCGGQCIGTTIPPYNNSSLPSITCVVSGTHCPSGSFCSQTQVCNGLCISTPATVTASSTPTATPCGGTHGRQCDKKYKCVGQDGKHCGAQPGCYGFCEPK